MEQIITKLVQDFEQGKMTRRQLIKNLTIAAAAAIENNAIHMVSSSVVVPPYPGDRRQPQENARLQDLVPDGTRRLAPKAAQN